MEYIAYLLLGIGIGMLMTLRGNGDNLQNAKDELEAKKEWLKMISNQKNKTTWPEGWK